MKYFSPEFDDIPQDDKAHRARFGKIGFKRMMIPLRTLICLALKAALLAKEIKRTNAFLSTLERMTACVASWD